MKAWSLFFLTLVGCGGASPPPPVAPDAPTATPPPTPAPTLASETPPEPVDAPPSSPSCQREDAFGPVEIAADAWSARRFVSVTKLSELKSSQKDPAKACGARDSYESIARLTCDDGSQPLGDASQVQRARQGNVGPGGVCGNVVDLYVVACPEGEHQIYVDMYWCPKGQGFF